MHHQESTHHAEGLVAHARVAQEDDHESIGFECPSCRSMADLPPLVAVLQPDDPEHRQRDDEHPDDPRRVEV